MALWHSAQRSSKLSISLFAGLPSLWCLWKPCFSALPHFKWWHEKKDSIFKAIEELAALGVVVGGNVFHPDPQARLFYLSPISSAELIKYYEKIAEVYKRYGYKPFLSPTTMRGSLAWEAYYGQFKEFLNMKQNEIEDIIMNQGVST